MWMLVDVDVDVGGCWDVGRYGCCKMRMFLDVYVVGVGC